ncbi:MAG: carboxylesterase/lipase family protein [Planctomycetota bacterium]
MYTSQGRRRALAALGVLAFLLAPAGAQAGRGAVVAVEAGKVRGVRAAAGSKALVFRGIPFARPPVGPLRWKPPQPAQAWEGVRDGSRFGPSCVQSGGGGRGEQSEDCLYLNVWTAARKGEGLPVMVWIHGGSFSMGSGSNPIYDGRHFAEDGAVLVTINYRLGPFGFLAHPALSAESPRHASGNYGLLDQIAALKWVRKNIAGFGGDPANVTVFGESAGGVSVGCLLASPLAKGLFQRAILESGTADGVRAPLRSAGESTPTAEATGVGIARDLGLSDPGSDSPATAAALRAIPAGKLLAAGHARLGFFGKGNLLWPVVDGWVLPDPPGKILEAGQGHDVPVLLGTNADEGTLFLGSLPVKEPAGYKLLVHRFFSDHAERVLDIFPVDSPFEIRPAMARLLTVSAFLAPARRTARRLGTWNKSPVWLYHFTRVGPGARKMHMGATHGAEIFYVFGNLLKGSWTEDADFALSRTMHAAWLRFARTGDPNGGELPRWPAFRPGEEAYLEIGDAVEIGSGLFRAACDLFDEISRD